MQAEALRAKVASGKVLSRAELEQLGMLGGEAVAEESAVTYSELELKGIPAIADWWGTSKRTVERHRPRGCPFLRPWEIEDWWRANQKANPPSWMMDGVERWRKSVKGAGRMPVGADVERDERYVFGEEEWSIGEQLVLARKIARAYGERVEDLASKGEDFAAEDRRYQMASTKLRSLEKDAPRIEIEQGRAWPKGDVVAALTDVGTAMNAALDRFALTVAPLCVGRTEAEIVGIVEREVNRLRQPWSRMEFYADGKG